MLYKQPGYWYSFVIQFICCLQERHFHEHRFAISFRATKSGVS